MEENKDTMEFTYDKGNGRKIVGLVHEQVRYYLKATDPFGFWYIFPESGAQPDDLKNKAFTDPRKAITHLQSYKKREVLIRNGENTDHIQNRYKENEKKAKAAKLAKSK